MRGQTRKCEMLSVFKPMSLGGYGVLMDANRCISSESRTRLGGLLASGLRGLNCGEILIRRWWPRDVDGGLARRWWPRNVDK